MLTIDHQRCTLCEVCLQVCPSEKALEQSGEKIRINMEYCTLCSACVSACPEAALSLQRKAKTADTSAYRDVWIFAETEHEGKIKSVVLELITKGRKLADELGQNLCVVVLSDINPGWKEKFSLYGVDKVYFSQSDLFSRYDPQNYGMSLAALVNKFKPEIFLMGATHQGRDLAPSLAARMGLGLTADCTELSIDDDLLLQTRPAFGGNVMADIICPNTRPQMATVRPNVFSEPEEKDEKKTELVTFEPPLNENSNQAELIKEIESTQKSETGIEEAEIIVSGGRGVEKKENFSLLEELAEVLGGTVGCSRPIVEKGWMPKARQVGQSGKTVSPRIYFACGISGAVQHQVGIRNSDIIIAINEDEDAPIFDLADLAVVGDLKKVIPELVEKLRSQD